MEQLGLQKGREDRATKPDATTPAEPTATLVSAANQEVVQKSLPVERLLEQAVLQIERQQAPVHYVVAVGAFLVFVLVLIFFQNICWLHAEGETRPDAAGSGEVP